MATAKAAAAADTQDPALLGNSGVGDPASDAPDLEALIAEAVERATAPLTKQLNDTRSELGRYQKMIPGSGGGGGGAYPSAEPSPVAGADVDLYEVMGRGPDALADTLLPRLQGRFLTIDQALQVAQVIGERAVSDALFLTEDAGRRNPLIRRMMEFKKQEVYAEQPNLPYPQLLTEAEKRLRVDLVQAGMAKDQGAGGPAPTTRPTPRPASPVAEGSGLAPGRRAAAAPALATTEETTSSYVELMRAARDQGLGVGEEPEE